MWNCLVVIVVLGLSGPATGSISPYRKYKSAAVEGPNFGEPLFLTPYIESGQIEEGRAAAEVKPLKKNVQSYAGFFTLNKTLDTNMFFWYFPAEKNPETAPVAVWLQGGPGATSLYGLFEENGPFYVKKERGLKMRTHYWSQELNVIYIDNPVGTGFSYTGTEEGYCKDETQVGENLYQTIVQFFKLFPYLQKNDFFVTGESYGGKYVPAMAYTIHKNNPSAELKVNLKGIAIGNGLVDPVNMFQYSDYLYQIGLLDRNGKYLFKAREAEAKKLIENKQYVDAFKSFDELLNGDLIPYKSLFYNETKFSFYFNYLHNEDNSPYGDMNKYLAKDLVRRSIHVSNFTFNSGVKVEEHLMGDVMQSVAPWLEVLMDNYRVLIYNGQLDIIVAYPLTVNYLNTLQWSGSSLYKTAERKPWYVGSELAGFSKTVNTFTEVLVRNAGHMVPQDQPVWALDLITKFTRNVPLNNVPA